jgi:hypothetical protein
VAAPPGQLGPVQLLVIAFDDGSFDPGVLEQLERLRQQGAVALVDLLFVAKDRRGEVAELERSELSSGEAAAFGALARALVGLVPEPEGAGRNGSSPARESAWFVADEIPAGSAAAIALIEHRWAIPLRDAIESARGHDLVDRWIHREDLAAIGAELG